jgi:hypothetical protein
MYNGSEREMLDGDREHEGTGVCGDSDKLRLGGSLLRHGGKAPVGCVLPVDMHVLAASRWTGPHLREVTGELSISSWQHCTI